MRSCLQQTRLFLRQVHHRVYLRPRQAKKRGALADSSSSSNLLTESHHDLGESTMSSSSCSSSSSSCSSSGKERGALAKSPFIPESLKKFLISRQLLSGSSNQGPKNKSSM